MPRLCKHTATVPSYNELNGESFIIIGGCESGVDAAYHLALQGKKVQLFDSGCPWESTSSEPSIALSPYSLERMRSKEFMDNVELCAETLISSVEQRGKTYQIVTADGECFETNQAPLLAHGFAGSHTLVADLFEAREDGYPLLNENDESTISPGLFLCGPAVRHDNLIFCFIYKYRQRFAVVAKAIATSLDLPAEGLETYRAFGMYLDDLSCCGKGMCMLMQKRITPANTTQSRGRLQQALRIEWLAQTTASLCWIASVFAYGISSTGDWLQLIAGSSWLIANLSSIVTTEEA